MMRDRSWLMSAEKAKVSASPAMVVCFACLLRKEGRKKGFVLCVVSGGEGVGDRRPTEVSARIHLHMLRAQFAVRFD